ncbi:MAG: hypothetical protein H0T47_17860 [Planctomycetaceae bacterium]|nr:hypothetical protein [Planctomycetaceae bacterium]
MSKTSLLDRLRGKARQAEQAAVSDYRQLVTAIADDDEFVDDEAAERILRESGHTVEDAERDAARLRERRQLRVAVDAVGEETRQQWRDANAAVAALKQDMIETLERTRLGFLKKIADAEAHCVAISTKQSRADNARVSLRGTAPPALRDEWTRISKRHSDEFGGPAVKERMLAELDERLFEPWPEGCASLC